jgi:tol-pal system protein YbgF
LIDNVVEGVPCASRPTLNVRLSTVSQELDAAAGDRGRRPRGRGCTGTTEPRATRRLSGRRAGAHHTAGSAPFISPQRMYDNAYSDYMGGQFDLAIQGFNAYIASFPKSDLADDAQLNIGNAYYAAGKYREAADAFQKVITNYPQSNTLPVAYYKQGLTYTELKQLDQARKAFETVMQKYPSAPENFSPSSDWTD